MLRDDTKVAVVTGGSRGIGEDIGKKFLEAGYKVINISKEESKYKHKNLETIILDLSDRAGTEKVGREIADRYKVTVFVHNAGVIRPDLLEDVKLDDLDYLTQLHIGSATTLMQIFSTGMREAQFGRVVLISSRGVLGLVTRSNYAATKAGQIGLVRTWTLELAKDGITVNAVAPGPIVTDMFHELVPDHSEQKEKVAESVPVKRLGTPEDISRVVAFLCEPESSFITGQTWYVCGGASLGALAL